MPIDISEYREWKDNRITKVIIESLNIDREDIRNAILSGNLDDKRYLNYVGHSNAIEQVLSYIEDFNNIKYLITEKEKEVENERKNKSN